MSRSENSRRMCASFALRRLRGRGSEEVEGLRDLERGAGFLRGLRLRHCRAEGWMLEALSPEPMMVMMMAMMMVVMMTMMMVTV